MALLQHRCHPLPIQRPFSRPHRGPSSPSAFLPHTPRWTSPHPGVLHCRPPRGSPSRTGTLPSRWPIGPLSLARPWRPMETLPTVPGATRLPKGTSYLHAPGPSFRTRPGTNATPPRSPYPTQPLAPYLPLRGLSCLSLHRPKGPLDGYPPLPTGPGTHPPT